MIFQKETYKMIGPSSTALGTTYGVDKAELLIIPYR